MALNNHVIISVDRDFFEKLFEPSRKKIQKKLGIKVSHPKFSRMLLKSKTNLVPKLNFDFNSDRQLSKLMAKRRKSGKNRFL